MKKNFKYVTMMAVALLLGFSSCSSDEDGIGGSGTPQEGLKTYASIKFSTPKTYGTPQSGTAAESKINTIDVFIYDAGGFLKDHQQFNAFTETTPGSGVFKTDAPMQTTTGAKQVYMAVNLPAAISTSLTTTNPTIAALSSVAQTVTVADIASDNNFVMGSDVASATFAEWDGTGTAPATNDVKVSVKRFAAKLTLEETATLTLDNVDGGTLANLKYALGQVNLSTYAAQKVVTGVVQDPNFTAPATPGDGLSSIPAIADYIIINPSGTAVINLLGRYAPENTNDNTTAGNLTYMSVQAEFIPEKVLTGTTGNWVEQDNAAGLADFWCIKTVDGNIYFNSEVEANAYATEYSIPGSNILKYTGGICYYTVYVNQIAKYDVYRNDFYQVKVDKILGLGESAPGPKDPTLPVDVQTIIEITVEIMPWNLEVENVSLTPQ